MRTRKRNAFESLVNTEGSKTANAAYMFPVCLRVLLIQKEVKLSALLGCTLEGLRVLLIQKEVKHEYWMPIAAYCLRVLLIQKEVKLFGSSQQMQTV